MLASPKSRTCANPTAAQAQTKLARLRPLAHPRVMFRRLRSRAADATVRVLSRGDAERMAQAIEQVQHARARVEEVEGAILHFWLLPSRADLRTLRRRVQRLRRELRAVEGELSRLEALVEDEQS